MILWHNTPLPYGGVLDPIGVVMNMKKLTSLILAICIALTLVSCGNRDINGELHIETPLAVTSPVGMESQEEADRQEEFSDASYEPFEGKIAIITSSPESGQGDYTLARKIEERYEEGKIVLRRWPSVFDEARTMKMVTELADNPDIRVIVAFRPLLIYSGIFEAFEELREIRDDIFLIFCFPMGLLEMDIALLADLVLITDEANMSYAIAQQAQRLGASTIVHHAPPRHKYCSIAAERRELIERKSAEIGIQFADFVAVDIIITSAARLS